MPLSLLLVLAVSSAQAQLNGVVRADRLPIPGATVTATQGAAKLVTTTDENGRFRLAAESGSMWNVTVQMFGFVTSSKLNVAAGAAEIELSLTLATRPAVAVSPANRALALNRTTEEAIPELPAAPEANGVENTSSPTESFLVSGSVSRGLEVQDRGGPQAFGFPPGGAEADAFTSGAPNIFAAEGQPQAGAGRGGPGGGRGGPPGGGFGGGGFGGRGPGGFAGRPPGGAKPVAGAKQRPGLAGRNVAAFGNRRRRVERVRGSAQFGLNNSIFDARQYSLTGRAIEKPSYARARYGIQLGGPLLIPKLIHDEKTFFFLDYNGTSSRNPFNVTNTVPSMLERTGDFSQSLIRGPVTIYDPAANLPFAGNRIPASRIDPAAAYLLGFFPQPNQPTIVQNYQWVTSFPNNSHALNVRMGRPVTAKDRLNGAFSFQKRSSENVNPFQYRDETAGFGWNANIGWTRNVSATFIHHLRFNFSRNRSETIPFFASLGDVAAQLGIRGTSRDPANFGPPNLTFTNFAGLTDANPVLRRDQTASINDSITSIRGRHTMRAGFEFRRNQYNLRTDNNGRGTFNFSGLLTSRLDANGNPANGTGFDLADLLLALPQSSSVRFGNASMYFRQSNYGVFVQDDFRVNAKLTLNGGLRWDYQQPITEKFGRIANLDLAPGFTGAAVVTPGASGPFSGAFPAALIDPDRNNFSPRLAAAYKPSNKSPLLLRASYGLYYNGGVYNRIAQSLGQQPPFASTNFFTTSVSQPLTITTGFLGLPSTLINNTLAVARDYRVGYAQSWTASVQMTLTPQYVLEVSYAGTKGTGLDVQRLPNQAPPGSPADSESRRPIPNAVGFNYESADGNSIYHSGQVRFAKRMRRGISFNTSYVYAKSIDNVSSYGGGQTVVAQNAFDLAAERGRSSFDRRHTFSSQFVLTAPFPNNKWLKEWTLSGGVSANSGTPLTALVLGNRSNNAGTGIVGSGRADATGAPVDTPGTGRFFNPGAFALPPNGRLGNAGRNTIDGPGFFRTDLNFGRSFALGERRRLEFRAEANNVFNTVNFTRLGVTVNANNYGLPTATSGMRNMQMQLRFRF